MKNCSFLIFVFFIISTSHGQQISGEKIFESCLVCHNQESRTDFGDQELLKILLNPSDIEQGVLWQSVANDEMPYDATLSENEKLIFKTWLKDVLAKKIE
jgi:hypothetical protein